MSEPVSEIMTPNPFTVSPDTPVKEAAKLLAEKRIGSAPVVEGTGLVGVVSESDLIMKDMKLEFPSYLHILDGFIALPGQTAEFEDQLKKAVAAKVSDVMSERPTTVSPETSINEVATLLVDQEISMLPVVEKGTLMGVVTKADIVKTLAN